MKTNTILTLFIFLPSINCYADYFNVCKDIVIDQVTGQAFGQHGVLYSGEVVCFRDKDEKILKYKRFYENGNPIGRHICYKKDGTPSYSISYDHTKVKKFSYNYAPTNAMENNFGGPVKCETSIDGACWKDDKCGNSNDTRCIFRCT